MSDAKQADTQPARHAGRTQPNVVTGESLLASLVPAQPASEAVEEPKEAPKTDEKPEDGKEKKNRFQERITELVNKRKEAEAKAEAAEREKQELRSRIERLEANQAKAPVEDKPKPKRDEYASQDEYEDAVTDWKLDKKLAEKAEKDAAAAAQAQQDQLESSWSRRQKAVMAEIEDYADVVGKAEIQLPKHLFHGILESEQGPYMAYYFAKHPDEAKRFAGMTPTAALRQLGKLEDLLLADLEPEPPKSSPVVEKSKAPPPPKQIKDTAPVDSGPAKSFEDYRARRQAEQAAKKR